MTDDEALRTVTLYCSHEALALEYDRALTRVADGRAYGLSGHFLWVGERTRQLDGAHIDFISRIANPIGVKLGPTTTPGDRHRAVREAQPGQRPGPAHADQPDGQPQGPRRAAADRGEGDRHRRTRWCGSATRCTATPTSRPTATRPATSTGSSTRCSATSRCTASWSTHPGGLHIELTGEDVTECLGGAQAIEDVGPARPVRDRLRPAAEHPAVAGAGVPRGGDAAWLIAIVDLRTDTVTRPTAAMRAAMAAAEVGDDVYGEDPTVNALRGARSRRCSGTRRRCSRPTGSMANQIALQLLVPPGDELLCDADAHVVTYEIGAAAAIGGISTRTWPAVGADLDPDAVARDDPPGRLLRGADPGDRGRADPQPGRRRRSSRWRRCARCAAVADDAGRGAALRRRPDLARARRRRGAAGRRTARCSTRCRSACPRAWARRSARWWSAAPSGSRGRACIRKRMGGGMRQAGILAAAGRYALDHHIDRLADDHARARRLAEALAPFGVVDPAGCAPTSCRST